MAFSLGNFNVDEIILGVAQDFDGTILYTLDQLSSASIEIASDSVDITDKRGNVVRTIYKTKTGTFTATNAFLHPQVMNAQSGSKIKKASASAPIQMPTIRNYAAGAEAKTVVLKNAVQGSVHVIGVYGNGGNTEDMSETLVGVFTDDAPEGDVIGSINVTIPAAGEGLPVSYIVKYQASEAEGLELVNSGDSFAQTVSLTLYCSIVDPCSDSLRAAYVVIPSFQASPEVTISLNADEQEMDFSGNLQTNYCDAEKLLYAIYFPDEDAFTTAIAA